MADSPDAIEAQVAIIKAGSNGSAIASVTAIKSLGVVRLYQRIVPYFSDEWPPPEVFQIYAQKNWSGVQKLRGQLAANPAIRSGLAARNIPINRVVGCKVYSATSIRVFLL